MRTRCSVPSKLILSGEHAVLYGCPALSMAIDLPTLCTLTDDEAILDTPRFEIKLKNFNLKQSFTFEQWQLRAEQVEQRFEAYVNDDGTIGSVLSDPFDLVLITLAKLDQIQPFSPANWQFEIESTAPIGRGLGSSAGVIVGVIKAVQAKLDWPMSIPETLELAKQIESYQHGLSSGIDPATLLYGGLLKYQLHQPPQPLPAQPFQGWLIDTGEPQSTTGECVTWVKQHHQNDKTLWEAFTQTTNQIEQAWSNQNQPALKQAIKQNHELLCSIGVVPDKVRDFIGLLNDTYDAAGKICGAGSITGQQAGMVLCISQTSPEALCREYSYPLWPVTIQSQGARCELD